ncbi:unnamed protein product [Parascedosporium putredinis]|uniref:S-adenosyl-L-methionine-dependent methyltransferase n=1 Tax=Parascedosporium putredinis TaxID=1442378 RepID=A0A9P1MCQ8_9PEZI|nr:unnamed protein product [Parascedosporium putredinis]CAI8001132.1 unnamed protein product [Parascedosporium putredinis]
MRLFSRRILTALQSPNSSFLQQPGRRGSPRRANLDSRAAARSNEAREDERTEWRRAGSSRAGDGNGYGYDDDASDDRAKRIRRAGQRAPTRPQRQRQTNMTEGSTEEVLMADVQALLKSLRVRDDDDNEDANADADADVYRHLLDEGHSIADYISVVRPGALRDDTRIRCRYFSQCSGCQFQMLDYPDQLRHKRTIVEKAFRNFSHLPSELVPAVADTIGSPSSTATAPSSPPLRRPARLPPLQEERPQGLLRVPPGHRLHAKGKRKVIDIEDCPIGTDAVRKGMVRERARMAADFADYSRGATILLRESTHRYPKDSPDTPDAVPDDAVRVDAGAHVDVKTCVTDNNATTTEFIDDHRILPHNPATPIKYLIDAYSGSGLFTISLASLFTGSIGIDIADKSIDFARKNAALNGMEPDSCSFIAADAGQLFKSVVYPADETVVVLDPPRKGCDADFLGQLLRFGPKRVVYVSCNVHTQARDVGALTGHVEGVAVLNRVEKESTASVDQVLQ